ncbi:serine/threonine-protein kinase [Patescibacteria group bacterium]
MTEFGLEYDPDQIDPFFDERRSGVKIKKLPQLKLSGGPSLEQLKNLPAEPRLDYGQYKQENQGTRYLVRVDEEGRLGEGGTANVYLGWDVKFKRKVAVKEWRMPNPAEADGRVDDEGFFELGAKISARADRPGVVPVYDYLVFDERAFVVMAYKNPQVEPSLFKWSREEVKRDEEKTVADKVKVLQSVAEAIDSLAGEGFLHRDLKPDSIFVNKKTLQIQLGDFGLGSLKRFGLDGNWGTASYTAPEVFHKKPHSLKSEVFSLGLIAYELLLGDVPPLYGGWRCYNDLVDYDPVYLSLAGSDSASEDDRKIAIREFGEACLPAVDKVFAKVFAKDPEDRYQTATDFINDLGGAIRARPTSKGQRKNDLRRDSASVRTRVLVPSERTPPNGHRVDQGFKGDPG